VAGSEIRVAIVGVGNCASSFIQGIEYYRTTGDTAGLGRPNIGGYRVGDIRPVVGFDVHPDKVGTDLSKAIWAGPNNAASIWDVETLDAPVFAGPVLDGAAGLAEWFDPVDEDGVDVAGLLRGAGADVVINWLPVGSTKATYLYAEAAIAAGCAFVNCIPVPLAATDKWASKFEAVNLPLLGDDIKSQIGATVIHRALAEIFTRRAGSGALLRTYQLNVGGNADFKNMHGDESRLVDKRASKQGAVTSIADLADENVHIGPSDFVPFLQDQKVAFMRLEGTNFGGHPVEIELRLAVQDSPNSAGVVVDAVRAAQVALDAQIGGALETLSAPLFKAPPGENLNSDSEADYQFDSTISEICDPDAPL
jgi:myo-inositol-1-phosphate synthase